MPSPGTQTSTPGLARTMSVVAKAMTTRDIDQRIFVARRNRRHRADDIIALGRQFEDVRINRCDGQQPGGQAEESCLRITGLFRPRR